MRFLLAALFLFVGVATRPVPPVVGTFVVEYAQSEKRSDRLVLSADGKAELREEYPPTREKGDDDTQEWGPWVAESTGTWKLQGMIVFAAFGERVIQFRVVADDRICELHEQNELQRIFRKQKSK
jgi:hypothetical protein